MNEPLTKGIDPVATTGQSTTLIVMIVILVLVMHFMRKRP